LKKKGRRPHTRGEGKPTPKGKEIKKNSARHERKGGRDIDPGFTGKEKKVLHRKGERMGGGGKPDAAVAFFGSGSPGGIRGKRGGTGVGCM